jgi:glyceraldehyde-3-phosphate dehydrogenase/erythrose-4-phosphate dehydrogenase
LSRLDATMARMVDTVRTWRTTQVVDGTLVKVMAWYDNEWGFTHKMVREAQSTLGATPARS